MKTKIICIVKTSWFNKLIPGLINDILKNQILLIDDYTTKSIKDLSDRLDGLNWNIGLIPDDSDLKLIPDFVLENARVMYHATPDTSEEFFAGKSHLINCAKQGEHFNDNKKGYNRLIDILKALNENEYNAALKHLHNWFVNDNLETSLNFLHLCLTGNKKPYKLPDAINKTFVYKKETSTISDLFAKWNGPGDIEGLKSLRDGLLEWAK